MTNFFRRLLAYAIITAPLSLSATFGCTFSIVSIYVAAHFWPAAVAFALLCIAVSLLAIPFLFPRVESWANETLDPTKK